MMHISSTVLLPPRAVRVHYGSTYYKDVRAGGGGGQDMCYERRRALVELTVLKCNI